MVDEQMRKKLVETEHVTLEGYRCTVAGWKNPYCASLSADFAGFWEVSWETAEGVLSDDRNFLAKDITLSSWAWLGLGVEVPEALLLKTRTKR